MASEQQQKIKLMNFKRNFDARRVYLIGYFVTVIHLQGRL